jgi:hypothetical protein
LARVSPRTQRRIRRKAQDRRGGPRLILNKTAEKSVRSFDAVSGFLYLDSLE